MVELDLQVLMQGTHAANIAPDRSVAPWRIISSQLVLQCALQTDEAFTVDMRALPPTVAEVYTLAILTSLEQRQAKSPSVAQRRAFVHPITLLLQPFDRNYIMWPSYVQKLNLHYAPAVLARQQEARRQAEEEARRAAHAARVAEEQMREFGEVAYEDHFFGECASLCQGHGFKPGLANCSQLGGWEGGEGGMIMSAPTTMMDWHILACSLPLFHPWRRQWHINIQTQQSVLLF